MVLDYLIENPNPELDLCLNSNMGIPPELVTKLIDRVNKLEGKIKSFTLFASIDTVGPKAEYIRFGLNEALFWENITSFFERVCWNVTVTFMLTVNGLSLTGMPDLYRRLFEYRRDFMDKRVYIDPPYLRFPEFLSAKIFPESFAGYLDQVIEFVKSETGPYPGFAKNDRAKVERIREWMLTKDVSQLDLNRKRRDFAIYIDEYDRRRKTDFRATFPEYVEFLELCRGIGNA
jgi:hypothetical protein